MCAKIAVIGMGQGGAVAALKLKEARHDVSIFEKEERGKVSYDWQDDIRLDIFGLCDIGMPPKDAYCQKRKWLFVSPDWKGSLPVPPLPPMEEISIYRRGLSNYFADLLEKAGCKLHFSSPVDGLLIEDDKVAGIRLGDESERFDLVIDASGMRSPFRAQVPKRYLVQAQPEDEGVLYGYRAFYERAEGKDTLEEGIECTMSLKQLGEEGISWCNLVAPDRVDVLIGRIKELSDIGRERAVRDLANHCQILTDNLYFGQNVEVCLRATIPLGIADGYVAIGDSAFMTMPLMGSGIEASMKAGKLFADMMGGNEKFDAPSLYVFWREYMQKYGADFAFIDVLKRWALSLPPKTLDWVFEGGLIEKSDLALISTDDSANKPKLKASSIFKKIGLLLGKPKIVCGAVGCVTRALKAKKCCKHMPKRYDLKKLAKWSVKYNKRIGAAK